MSIHDQAEPPRDGAGRFLRTVESAERDAEAIRLLCEGATYQRIADVLEYGDRSSAHRAVKSALAAIPAPEAAMLREVEGERLDRLIREAFAVLGRDHVHISQGGKVVRDDDGNLIYDDGPKLAAINTLVRLSERRAKLFGLDAPTRIKASVERDDEDGRERELIALIEQHRRRVAAPVPGTR